MPANATIKEIILSTRNNTINAGDSVTATAYVSACGDDAPVTTGIAATVDSTTACNVSARGTFTEANNTLMSVQITTVPANLALADGVAVTVIFE